MKRIAFLLIASLAIVLSNSSGSETLTSETLLPLHNSKDAYTPAMAYGKKGCLVVWQSGRTGEGSMVKSLLYGADLVACRVDMNGKPLDKEPIVLSSATDLQDKPHLAFGDKLDNPPRIFHTNYFLKQDGEFSNTKLDKKIWLLWRDNLPIN